MIKNPFKKDKTIYLDYVTATPVDPRVARIMHVYATEKFYNPGSLHKGAVSIKNDIASVRKSVADILHGLPQEVIFTSGATEANNLAVYGVVNEAFKSIKKPHIITSDIEHPSVKKVFEDLRQKGAEVTFVPINKRGVLDIEAFEKALKKNTVLVSVTYVNNEIGTVQPISELSKIIRRHRKNISKKSAELGFPLLHTDATQAVNYHDINVQRLNVDLMTLSGAKIYGPKGVGALYFRKGVVLEPMILGGAHEFGLRAGTLNIPAIMGFTEALRIVEEVKESEVARLTELRDYCFSELKKNIPEMLVNGDRTLRVANNVSVAFKGLSGEQIVIELDARGVAASAKSACKTSNSEESYVINALWPEIKEDLGVVRFSLGRGTTQAHIDKAVLCLTEIVRNIRQAQKKLSEM